MTALCLNVKRLDTLRPHAALLAYAHPVLTLGAYILFVQDVIPETPGKLQPPKKQLAGKGAAVGRQASGLPPRQGWHLLSLASDRKLLRVKPPSLIHQQLAV